MEDKISRIITLIRKKDLVIFVGAGISLKSPSFLLGFRDLQNEIIYALCKDLDENLRQAYEAIYKEIRNSLISNETAIKFANIPPEYLFELCRQNIIPRDGIGEYYELKPLEIFKKARPNSNHYFLAQLLVNKAVPAVITTNFDLLIETAFDGVSATQFSTPQIDRYWRPEHFIRNTLNPGGLIKLHGSIDDLDSIIISLDEIGRNCAFNKLDLLKHFLKTYHVLFLGFKGADLDIFGCLATTNCKGLIWNTISEDEMLPKIRILLEEVKGDIIAGDLGEVLFKISCGLGLKEWSVESPSEFINLDFSKQFEFWARNIHEYSRVLIVGNLWEYIAEWGNALRFFKKGYELARKLDDVEIENVFLGKLSDIFYKLGRYKEVKNICDLRLENSKGMNQASKLSEYIKTLQLLAIIEQKSDIKKAINLLIQALEYQEKLEKIDSRSRYKKGDILLNVANIFFKGGLMDDALGWYQSALEIFDEYGNVQGRANALANIGTIHLQKGKLDDCINFYGKAEYLFHETKDLFGLSRAWVNLAIAYYRKGEKRMAKEYAYKSKVCFVALSDKGGEKKASELIAKTT